MKSNQELERLFKQEFRDLLPNTIWQKDNGVYEVFGHYQIEPANPGYRVTCSATEVGKFSSTKTALSWCIADKHRAYNVARELLETDTKLSALINDISARIRIGERSSNPVFRESVTIKLETKIIHKNQLENQLAKYINWAKYCQQRGFKNEAQRTGQSQPIKTSR